MEIDQVFAPLGLPAFLRDYWLKSFVHVPARRGRFSELLTWNELNAILEQHRLTPPRLKLYRDGQQIPPAQYLTPAEFGVPRLDSGGLAVSLAKGASLILDEVQELAPRVRDLLASFQTALHTDAYANLYAGWHTQRAFSQHWDSQEVVVLQLYGRKRWKVWRPTRQHPLKGDSQTLSQPAGEPVWDAILEDGGALYLPRGWWHEVCPLDEPSLHLSVSLTPPNGLDYLGWLASRLHRHPELRATLAWNDESAHSALTDAIARFLTEAMRETPPADYLREWEANIRPIPHIRLPKAPYAQLADITEKSRIRLAALNLLSFSRQGEHFVFPAAGRLWTIPALQQPVLARLRNGRDIVVRELVKPLSDPAAKGALMASLSVLAHAGVILVAGG